MHPPAARCLALFDAAAGLDPAGRAGYLDVACAGDAALRARVDAMLAADGREHTLLDQAPAAVSPPADQDQAGARIGPYRLVRELGRGGMGVVWLAEREDVAARVAIKLLAPDPAMAERRARFEHERRLLARLTHPGIARFLDAGVTTDGTLWLAMEHVEGRPLHQHCDAFRLPVRERVTLIAEAGEAVAYAHRNLLIHRDLKPSNILVSAAGAPRLLDFGIAKLLAGDDVADAITRDAIGGPMTPEYASPEQVRGDPLTTASDVYQLGILLYELLTGRRPVGRDGEVLRPFARAKCTSFLPPSQLVRTEVRPAQVAEGSSDRTAPELSALRGATPGQLSGQLAGDLDAIVAKALSCTASERYGSARELVDDLRRYLEGQPIQARPPSVAYRAARFIRRHTVSVALAGTLSLLLAASAVMSFLQARAATRQRDRAERVSQILEQLLGTALPGAEQGDTLRAAILRSATEQARAGLRDDPRAAGRILTIVGFVHEKAGRRDTAIALWREVIAQLEPRVQPDDSLLLDVVGRLGVTLVTGGEFEPGLRLLEEMLGRARRLPAARGGELATALYDAGFGRQIAGDDRTARRLYLESLERLTSLPDSGGPQYDRTLLNLGFLANRTGDPAAAERFLRSALARRLARDGPAHDRTLGAMTALAQVLTDQGRLAEADTLSRAALERRRKESPEGGFGLADALGTRARYLAAAREGTAGEPLAHEGLALARRLYGDTHQVTAYMTGTLALTVAAQDRWLAAAALQREAVARYRKAVGDRHPGTVRGMIRLAEYERRLGRTAEAEALYREALPVLDSIVEGRPAIAPALTGFGMLLAETGRCAAARPYLERAALWSAEARAGLAGCPG